MPGLDGNDATGHKQMTTSTKTIVATGGTIVVVGEVGTAADFGRQRGRRLDITIDPFQWKTAPQPTS